MARAELLQPLPLPQPQSRWSHGVIVVAAMVVALSLGLSLGGAVARFSASGLAFAPLILLAGLLHLRQWRVARVLSWIWFWLLLLGVAAIALVMVVATAAPESMLSSSRATENEMQLLVQQLVAPAIATVSILLAAIPLAATPLWAKVGRLLGAGLDRAHPAHAQGTVGLIIGSALAIAPLALLGGRAPLVDLLDKIDPSSIGVLDQVVDQASSVVWTIVFVLWAAAWPARASLREAAERLGVTRVDRRVVLPLMAITLGMVGLGTALDVVNRSLLGWLGWPITDASVITRLMTVASTPLGAVFIAVCAGTSEELLFRGLLQPRFGWLLANVGFAAMHAFQYGVDGLIVVFVMGGVLAFVRQRWNTSAAMAVHVSYDLILLLLAQFGF